MASTTVRTLEEIADKVMGEILYDERARKSQRDSDRDILIAALREAVAQERAAMREWVSHSIITPVDKYILDWLDAREKSE